MSVFRELKRRNVFRVGAAYLAGAWLLVQLVNEIFPLYGFSDAAGRLAVTILAIGFVPALVVAWVFELTPEGLKRDAGLEASRPADERSLRRFDRAIMVVLALALALFAVDRFILDPGRDAALVEAAAERARSEARLASFADKSIAVLPFEDLSESGDQEWFSDGISEALLNLLAKIPELRVAGRTSAFSFKGKDVTIPEIAEALSVAHVLEGSVRRAGNQLRITAQLIDARTDTHLWSDAYDREMGDVFAIQDEIAAQVADALRITLLGPAPRVDETSPEVHDLYQQAAHINRNLLAESYPLARQWLEEAIDRDPNYLPVYLALVFTYRNLPLVGDGLDRADAIRLARRTLDEAFHRWPERPEILAARAWAAFQDDGDLEAAARYYERALSAGGNISAALVPFTLALNRPETAVEIGKYVVARDPLCMVCYINLVQAYVSSGRYDEAKETYLAARALGLASSRNLRSTYGMSLLLNGDGAAALAEFEAMGSAPAFESRRLMGSAMALHDLGREDEFAAKFAELEALPGDRGRLAQASVSAYIGDLDAAFEVLNALPALPIGLFDYPPLDVMRSHRLWEELAARAGLLPQDPRADIVFEVNLPE